MSDEEKIVDKKMATLEDTTEEAKMAQQNFRGRNFVFTFTVHVASRLYAFFDVEVERSRSNDVQAAFLEFQKIHL